MSFTTLRFAFWVKKLYLIICDVPSLGPYAVVEYCGVTTPDECMTSCCELLGMPMVPAVVTKKVKEPRTEGS